MEVPKILKKEVDPKSKKIIFVGDTSMGYRLLDPVTNNIVISNKVQFNEEN